MPAGSPRVPTGRAGGNEGAAPPPPSRFHTPPGHFNNPMDNVYAATLALDRIPLGNSPREVETQRAVEMLRTAVVQQANYPDNRSGMHGTPYNSQSKSRQGESPRHIQSSSARRRAELERQQMPPPPPRQPAPAASASQAIVDNSRARCATNSAARAGGAGQAPEAAPAAVSSPIPRARPVHANMSWPRCLSGEI